MRRWCGRRELLLTISAEPPDQPEIAALLAESDAFSAALYPPESRRPVSIGWLAGQSVRFLVARREERAVGCGALVIGADGAGELKRLIVSANARAQGIGAALLAALENLARAAGLQVLRLETGPKSIVALALYRRAGFVQRGPFGDYAAGIHSVFMEKWLVAPGPSGATPRK